MDKLEIVEEESINNIVIIPSDISPMDKKVSGDFSELF